jgi:adenine-specific DNA-methyltransferase
MSSNLKNILERVLKTEPLFLDSESGELNYIKVKDSADRIDPILITLLADNDELKAKFFIKIKDIYVFNIKDFKFFLDESKVDNSYTDYSNKIGLANSGGLLENISDVVLDFPFKDCVLEGGQSTEEGTDSYYEYDETVSKDEIKKGYKAEQYNLKQAKRKEVFFNQVIAHDEIDRLYDQKTFVNWKRYTKDSSKDGELLNEIKRDSDGTIRENLIIKGNNLLALYSVKSEFAGKVKLIYIDPPYNTENDSFVYNDNFTHSTWLTFMKNRLEIAKKLLSDDGSILVHCDFNEDSYLKVLMDEVFGRNNYLNTISVRDSHPSGLKLSAKDKTIIKTKSSIIVYRKTNKVKIKPIYQVRKDWDTHFNVFLKINKEDVIKYPLQEYIKVNNIVKSESFKLNKEALKNSDFKKFAFENRNNIFQSTKEIPKEAKALSLKNKDIVIAYSDDQFAFNGRRLSPLSKSINSIGFDGYDNEDFSKLICDFWDDIDFNNSQNEGGVSLASGKKPEYILARLVTMFTNKGEIVLDYHAGSGTTCAVAHKMGRQWIGVEQLDYNINNPEARLKNVVNGDDTGISSFLNWQGGGDFIYCELAKWNEKAKEEIQSAKDYSALVKLLDRLYEKYFLNYNVKVKDLKEKIIKEEEFKKLSLDEQKRMFLTMLDLNQMYVNESEMADKKYGISTEDQKLTKSFYSQK